MALVAAVSSLIAASLVLDDGGGLGDSGEWSTVAVTFGKGVYGLVPYIIYLGAVLIGADLIVEHGNFDRPGILPR